MIYLKKYTLLLSLIICIVANTTAQVKHHFPKPADKPTWIYGDAPTQQFIVYKMLHDTDYQGRTYSAIYRCVNDTLFTSTNSQLVLMVREDSLTGNVYGRYPINPCIFQLATQHFSDSFPETLLMPFNAQKGDTLVQWAYSCLVGDTATNIYIVDSVNSSFYVDGRKAIRLKILISRTFSSRQNNSLFLIEGIGYLMEFLFHIYNVTDYSIEYEALNCFSLADTLVYKNNPNNECFVKKWPDGILELEDDDEKNFELIYPNPLPTNGTFAVTSIYSTIKNLEFIDVAGRMLWQTPFGTNSKTLTIDTQTLGHGPLWMRVIYGNGEVKSYKLFRP